MTGQQLTDLQLIAFKIRHLAECMMAEGMPNYSLTLLQYADMIEKVIW